MPASDSARDQVRRYLEGRPTDRSPIVLHLGPYAARLQQMSYRQVCADPTLLANSLQSSQKLFGCDGLIILVDSTLEAEACGCEVVWQDDEPTVASHPLGGEGSTPPAIATEGVEGTGRLVVAFEAAQRLAAVIGKDVALFPAVTGPVTLAAHLRGPSFWTDLDEAPNRANQTLETAGRVMVGVARQYLDAGFEQLLVSDPLLGRVDPPHYPAVAAVLRTLWNVAEFYDARVLLQTDLENDSRLEGLLRLGAARLVVEGCSGAEEFARRDECRASGLVFGVPAALIEGDPDEIEHGLSVWHTEVCGSDGLVVCCAIPRSTPPANVHRALQVLRC